MERSAQSTSSAAIVLSPKVPDYSWMSRSNMGMTAGLIRPGMHRAITIRRHAICQLLPLTIFAHVAEDRTHGTDVRGHVLHGVRK